MTVQLTRPSPEHEPRPAAPVYAQGSAFVIDRYVPITKAMVPITDGGFARADGVYDVVSVWSGMFFRLEDHLTRFENSCAKIRVRCPYSRDKVRGTLIELVRLAGLQEAYVWFGCTRGEMPHDAGERSDPEKYENRFYAWAVPYVWIAEHERRSRGLHLYLSKQYVRIPPTAVDPTAKNYHWLDLMMSLFEAGDNNAEWSVLTDADGYLTEAPGANVFMVKDGRVLTPNTGGLEGVTRQTTLDLCGLLEIPCERMRIHMDKFVEADEIFITSTAGGIIPCGTLDGRAVGGREGPGPLTLRLYDEYWKRREEGWLGTPVECG